MNTRPLEAETPLAVDDMSDDVAAAWREASERAPVDDTAPASETPALVEGDAERQVAEGRDARGRLHDERGRFAAKAKAEEEADAAAKAPGAEDEAAAAAGAGEVKPGEEAPAAATAAAPPPSWGVKAKAAWDSVPPAVRDEIAKREVEVGQGLAALRDFKDLKPYAEMAQQQGTTISKALDHYTGIDRLMQQDLPGGLGVVAESYGKSHAEIGAIFADLAKRYGHNVAPAAGGNQTQAQPGGESDPLMEVLKPVIQPLMDKIAQLEGHHTSRAEQDRNAQVRSVTQEINKFAADPKNIYYPNVEADIANLFAKGMVPLSGNPAADLQAAYDLAVRMHPEISQALIEKRLAESQATQRQRDQEAADKARKASRSMGGSKVPGTLYKERQEANGSDDIEADVKRAYRTHSQA